MSSEASSCSNQNPPPPVRDASGSKRNHDQRPISPSSSDHPPVKRAKINEGHATKDQSMMGIIEVSNTIDTNVSSDISSEGTTEKGAERKSKSTTFNTKLSEDNRGPHRPNLARNFPSEIRLVQVGERHWMCDICRAAVFENFADACMHELACKSRSATSANMTMPFPSYQAPPPFQLSSFHAPSMFPPVSSVPFVGAPTAKSYQIHSNQPLQQLVRAPSVATVQPSITSIVQPSSNTYPNSFCADVGKSSGADNGKGVSTTITNPYITGEELKVSLAPEKKGVLSDYNYILSKNIQFFETPISPNSLDKVNAGSHSSAKVGLRCIHCASNQRHITAASFFPSSITSISSGMGTIGSRHFLGGKCPFLPKETHDELKRTKKMSQQQTRTQGRVGLDAYCRDLAKSRKIFDCDYGGIYFDPKLAMVPVEKKATAHVEVSKTPRNKPKDDVKVPSSKIVTRKSNTTKPHLSAAAIVKSVPPKDEIPDRNDPSAFKESELEHFWECKHCKSLPLQWRATGSVVFSVDAPTIDIVGRHLSVCQGATPLRIPRDASMKLQDDNSGGTKVLICWDNTDNTRKSHRIKGAKLAKKKRPKPIVSSSVSDTSSLPLKPGVENEALALEGDKSLTTDFAYFTILQMKKCYLTKAGGSRGNCPVGYPGLACGHCAGDAGERRFFYTSADHLRNSFSHIPSHLIACTKCPIEVKEKIESYKSFRNKQKSQLKGGDHKIFIDRVWSRLHGPGGGVIVPLDDSHDTEDDSVNEEDDRSINTIAIEVPYEPDEFVTQSLDGRYLENKKISIETHKSPILTPSDRKLVTDYVYYSLLQMVPKQYQKDSSGNLRELEVEEEEEEATTKDEKDDVANKASPKKEDVVDKTGLIKKEAVFSTDPTKSDKTGITDYKKGEEADTTQHQKGPKVETEIQIGLKTQTNDIPTPIVNNTSTTTEDTDEKIVVKSEDGEEKSTKETQNEDADDEKMPEIIETLVCKHCLNEDMQCDFLPESAEDIRKYFAEIPKHIMSCPKCPEHVKFKLKTLKAFRAVQESMLKRGSQKKFVNAVWRRLDKHFLYENDTLSSAPAPDERDFASEVLSTTLLSESDRALVSEFTFYTMQQMEPCILENSGNGARSMFAFGFPGLGCKHCAGKPNARKFFYRTPDILSGNYAHIPNHVMSCKHTPLEVKQTLAAKKRLHAEQKQRLQRGSQRVFFNNAWDRLHKRKG